MAKQKTINEAEAVKFLESLRDSADQYNSVPVQRGEDWFHLNLGCSMGERVAAFFKKQRAGAK